jgi:hypothetical protein
MPLAEIAPLCPRLKKDRLVGLLLFNNAVWLVQRRAEAGQLQQRRVNFYGLFAAGCAVITGRNRTSQPDGFICCPRRRAPAGPNRTDGVDLIPFTIFGFESFRFPPFGSSSAG